MTSMFSARKRAEEFAVVVDGATPSRPELAELAGVVTTLRGFEAPAPRAEFAADLRARLMAEAATTLSPSAATLVLPARPRGKRERRLVAAASAVVFIGGTASMAAAAQSALPGEVLYPIKRGIEQAQTGLSTSQAGKGRDLLSQANDRLTEVRGLLTDGSPSQRPQVPQTLADYTEQARQGASLMLSSFQDTQDPATITAVREFSAHGITALKALAGTAPADAQDDLATAAATLSDIDQQARDLCADCAAGLPDLQVPSMFLASAEVQRALSSVDATRLDNSHPVVVDKRAVKSPVPGVKSTAPAQAGPLARATPTAPAAPESSPTPSTGLPVPQLPGVDEQATKRSTDLGRTVDSTVTGITNGLGGVAETLLPDLTSPLK
jgi:hypothetical protein